MCPIRRWRRDEPEGIGCTRLLRPQGTGEVDFGHLICKHFDGFSCADLHLLSGFALVDCELKNRAGINGDGLADMANISFLDNWESLSIR